MATGTYKKTTNTTATYGENSAANAALQSAINATGKATVAVDSKYGDKTKAAVDSLTSQGYTYKNGSFVKSSTTNPVISGSSTRSENESLGNDIKNISSKYNSSALDEYTKSANKLIEDRLSKLESNYESQVSGIKSDYEQASALQDKRQEKEYAGRSTSLITSGGGFLGATQSQQGVLQNLSDTHEQERIALIAKRDAAIQAAKDAYDEKSYALASEQLKLAKETEQELYNREQDFADQKLALTKEARSQQEFEMGITDKKVESYATMSDEEFAKIDTTATDKYYYPGYTEAARNALKKANDIKTAKDAIDLEKDVLEMRLKIPAGQKFSLNGVTYTGLDTGSGGTADERKNAQFEKMSELLSGKTNTEGTQLYTIPGSQGIPYIDSNGYLTPEGWAYISTNAGLNANDLIERYANLFDENNIGNYKLSSAQKTVIQGKL